MEDIRSLPGYKAVLRAVIKAQIQQLVSYSIVVNIVYNKKTNFSKAANVDTLELNKVHLYHRRRKWGPNILSSCRFGAAVFFDTLVVCFKTQT